MWDGLLILLLLSIVMGVASFLSGMLPLSFALSPRQLRLITALGTGVLVGTALIVIIPEGVATLYSSTTAGHAHNVRRMLQVPIDSVTGSQSLPVSSGYELDRRGTPLVVHTRDIAETFHSGRDDTLPPPDFDHETSPPPMGDRPASGDNSPKATKAYEPHVWIGISLITGFILMYLIDTLPQTAASFSQPQRFHVNLNQFSLNSLRSTPSGDAGAPAEDEFTNGASSSPGTKSRASSTTVGLVIHAAADGIALGASSSTASAKLSFIIFLALMIHKAPAAFGLTSVLLKQGLSKRMARAHLIIFSLAAPIGALLTWAAIQLLGLSSRTLSESTSTEFATGVLLLFSGGTFLYVSVHTMQQSASGEHSHGGEAHGANGYADVPMGDPYAEHAAPPPKAQGPTFVDTMLTVGGMLLPILTQFGHSH